MASFNKATLIGHVGRDPESRTTQGGQVIANFSLATSESWTDKGSGERKEKTQWHNVVVMNENVAATVEKYVRKGSQVFVEGSIQSRKWTDKNGNERHTTEVVIGRFDGRLLLLDKRETSDASPRSAREAAAPAEDINDEIPF